MLLEPFLFSRLVLVVVVVAVVAVAEAAVAFVVLPLEAPLC